jgi:hypothetical protein
LTTFQKNPENHKFTGFCYLYLLHSKHGQSSCSVSTQDQRLSNIGSFDGHGNKSSETIFLISDALTDLMHRGDNILFIDDYGQVLLYKSRNSLPQNIVRNPKRGVFGNAKIGFDQSQFYIFQVKQAFIPKWKLFPQRQPPLKTLTKTYWTEK